MDRISKRAVLHLCVLDPPAADPALVLPIHKHFLIHHRPHAQFTHYV